MKTKICSKRNKNKIYLITGGTGFLGQALVNRLIKKKNIEEIRIFSRDEFKQSEMMRKINNSKISYWLGSVKNLERLREACEGVDIIIHCAAMKRMDTISHNAYEVANVNICGTKNVVLAAKKYCKKIILVSTDKAFQPSCVYGYSKAIAESIVLADKKRGIIWRFGNFINSRGSVFEIFKEQKEQNKPLTITDPNATRFVIDMEDVCDCLLSDVKPGLYYPKNLKSMTVKEIADSIAPGHHYKIVGLREGEKLDESFNDNYSSKKK